MLFILKIVYRRMIRQAAYEILAGRMIKRGAPEKGRFLRSDVDQILAQTWRYVDRMLPEAQLEQIPTLGNRHNAFLALLTVAAYHAFLDAGVEREYAIELFAESMWRSTATGAKWKHLLSPGAGMTGRLLTPWSTADTRTRAITNGRKPCRPVMPCVICAGTRGNPRREFQSSADPDI